MKYMEKYARENKLHCANGLMLTFKHTNNPFSLSYSIDVDCAFKLFLL